MIEQLLALLAVMSLSAAPRPIVSPLIVYGQQVPIQPTLLTVASADYNNPKHLLPPHKKNSADLGVVISANSAFVADVASGGVLFTKNPHNVQAIASLTKLMTALKIVQMPNGLDGDITLVADDFSRESTPVFMIGDTLDKRTALKAMLTGSVNELANAFARTTGLSRKEFVEAMNKEAQDRNLVSFSFTDPTGLDAGNKGSAADVAALITIVLGQRDIRQAMNLPNVTVKTKIGRTIKIASTNLLLTSFLNSPPYQIIGAKTGSLPEAGYCLAQVTRNADGHEVVAVILGSDNHFSRYKDVKALTAWAFDAYAW